MESLASFYLKLENYHNFIQNWSFESQECKTCMKSQHVGGGSRKVRSSRPAWAIVPSQCGQHKTLSPKYTHSRICHFQKQNKKALPWRDVSKINLNILRLHCKARASRNSTGGGNQQGPLTSNSLGKVNISLQGKVTKMKARQGQIPPNEYQADRVVPLHLRGTGANLRPH